MKNDLLLLISLTASLCVTPSQSQAQAQPQAQSQSGTGVAAVLSELESTRNFPEVAISPDGKRIAWVEELYENGKDTGNSAIYTKELRFARLPTRISAGDGKSAFSERELAWSPDSSQLAFLSDREHRRQMQLHVASMQTGRASRLTSLTGYLTDPEWSPDGKRIALLFAENAPGGGGPLEAEPEETGLIGGQIHNQRLTLVNVATRAVKPVSPADFHVYEYDWSPDGRTFALTAARGPGDDNWWIAQLYTMAIPAAAIPAAAGETGELHAVYRPELQIAVPRWSPDGASIGFIEGLMSDEGFTGGDIFTVPAAGGEAVNRTPGRKSSVSWLRWLTPSKMIFTEIVGGGSAIGTIEIPGGGSQRLWQGDLDLHAAGNFPNFSLAKDGKTAAVVLSDWSHPPEVSVGPIGDWKAVTEANKRLQPKWGQMKNVEWTSDGFSVQGWLIYPRDFDAERKYPMVLQVHGGPANYNKPHWTSDLFDMTVLSSQNYFVFFPNPRGSYGQGEAFTRANVKDFGGGDLRDILTGVDAVLKIAPVDPERIGITGWSYGGYMTMWTVTQTHRFRAAVAGAGIANWLSYYGENSIDQWMMPYFGATVYDDPAVYAKSAPITFIKNVKTPTLVLVGERDGECPTPQSYEFWHALQTLGVKTDLVVYPGEGHMFRDSAHKRDVMERTIAWFEKYLQ